MDDVDRLSRGDAAKARGTGCRDIPHRLNLEERPVYESAKKKGFLAVRGTGYRRDRKGNPLPNIYRQWCDAKRWPCIVIEQDMRGMDPDQLVLDLSTLRLMDSSQVREAVLRLAEEYSAVHVSDSERPAEYVPFQSIPAPLPDTPDEGEQAASSSTPPPRPVSGLVTEEDLAAADARVEEVSQHIRQLKDSGLNNQSSEVAEAVQKLLQLKARTAELRDRAVNEPSNTGRAGNADAGVNKKTLPDDHPLARLAIWQIAPQPVFFKADRNKAKELAKAIMAAIPQELEHAA